MDSRRKAFTLIELLVVVAIIALLISILLPSLSQARESAKTVVCGAHLKQMGIALRQYLDDNQGWYPSEHCGNNVGFIAAFPGRIRTYCQGKIEIFWCPSEDERKYWRKVTWENASGRKPKWAEKVVYYGYDPDERPPIMGGDGDYFIYGYNSWGTNSEGAENTLGLGAHIDDPGVLQGAWSKQDTRIVQPSEMIVLADSRADKAWDTAIEAELFNAQEWPSQRHNGGAQFLHADAHVERMRQKQAVVNDPWVRRKWNFDNKPHEELWGDPVGGRWDIDDPKYFGWKANGGATKAPYLSAIDK